MIWANKKPRVETQGLGIENCVKSARVYPSPKPGLIMIAMTMLDDAELNMRFFNRTRSRQCQERL